MKNPAEIPRDIAERMVHGVASMLGRNAIGQVETEMTSIDVVPIDEADVIGPITHIMDGYAGADQQPSDQRVVAILATPVEVIEQAERDIPAPTRRGVVYRDSQDMLKAALFSVDSEVGVDTERGLLSAGITVGSTSVEGAWGLMDLETNTFYALPTSSPFSITSSRRKDLRPKGTRVIHTS